MTQTICVFCGAKKGVDSNIANITMAMGETMACQGIDIVCGGSDCGLMGIITDAALEKGGKVIGVFPDILNGVEIPHKGLTRLLRTRSLPERKQKMVDISDAFLILPGGYGTLDEIFEIIVLRRLNANQKPIILFNHEGFWDFTLMQIKRMVKEGFISQEESHLFTVVDNHHQFKTLMERFSRRKT